MKKNKLPLWRSIVIGLLMVVVFSATLVLLNIYSIIDYNLEPVTDDVYEYVDEHFGLNALSKDEYERFINKNKDTTVPLRF